MPLEGNSGSGSSSSIKNSVLAKIVMKLLLLIGCVKNPKIKYPDMINIHLCLTATFPACSVSMLSKKKIILYVMS
jgi:hypothetical protein